MSSMLVRSTGQLGATAAPTANAFTGIPYLIRRFKYIVTEAREHDHWYFSMCGGKVCRRMGRLGRTAMPLIDAAES